MAPSSGICSMEWRRHDLIGWSPSGDW